LIKVVTVVLINQFCNGASLLVGHFQIILFGNRHVHEWHAQGYCITSVSTGNRTCDIDRNSTTQTLCHHSTLL